MANPFSLEKPVCEFADSNITLLMVTNHPLAGQGTGPISFDRRTGANRRCSAS